MSRWNWLRGLVGLLAVLALGVAAPAWAGPLYFDVNPSTAEIDGGAANWSDADWKTLSDSTSGGAWIGGSDAYFPPIAGEPSITAVTLAAPATVNSMVFEGPGYTIGGGSMLTNSGNPTNTGNYVMNADGKITAPLGGNLYATGTGTLTFSGGLTTSNRIVVAGGGTGAKVVQDGGNVTVSGNYMMVGYNNGAAGPTLGGTGTYTINSGTLTIGAGLYLGWNGNTGTFTQNGGTVETQTNSQGLQIGITNGRGTYNLNGGTLISTIGGGGAPYPNQFFNFGGGTFKARATTASLATMNTTIASGKTAYFDSNTFTITWAGPITGTAAGGLTKQGAGTLILNGANTFGGAVTVNAGILRLGNASALGSNSTSATVANGAVLDLNGQNITRAIPLTLGGTYTQNGPHALFNSSTATATYAGAITLNNPNGVYIGGVGSGNLNLPGNISGGAGAYLGLIQGNETVKLSGSSTFVEPRMPIWFNGTLQVEGGRAIPDGARLELRNSAVFELLASETIGSLDGAATNTVKLNANQLTLGADNSTAYTHLGAITGGGSLVKVGTGTQTLAGPCSYTGSTTVNSGTLALNFAPLTAPTSNIINGAANESQLVLTGGTLAMQGKNGVVSSQWFNGLVLPSGDSRIVMASGTGGSALLDLGAVTRSAGTVSFSLPATGGIQTTSGAAGSVLTDDWGAAYATVNGNDWAAKDDTNTFVVGAATLAGLYTAQNNVSAWAADQNITNDGVYAGTLANSAAINTLRFNHASAGVVTINPAAILTVNTGGILVTPEVGANLSEIAGGMLQGTAGKSLTIFQNNASAGLNIGSVIVDNAFATGLVKSGPGDLTLSGENTYTGDTVINAGKLVAGGAAAIPSGESSGNMVVHGTLDLNGFNLGVNSLSGSGIVTNGGGAAATLDVSSNIASTFSGVIQDGTSAVALTKTGPESLLLTGANTFTGGTLVTQGQLQLGNGGAGGSLAGNIVLAADTLLALNRAGVYTVNNSISGEGGLAKIDGGTATLDGDNSYSGATAISAGVVKLGSPTALGNTSLATIAATARLDLNGQTTSVPLRLEGFGGSPDPVTGTGGLFNSDMANTAVLNGDLTLGTGGPYIGGTGNIMVNGAIAGGDFATPYLAKINSGTLTITSNNAAAVNWPRLAVWGGTVKLGADDALPTGIQVDFNSNATLDLDGHSVTVGQFFSQNVETGLVKLGDGGVLTFGHATFANTFRGVIEGAGQVVKQGSGTAWFAGANTYTGSTTVAEGALQVVDGVGLPTTSNLVLNGGVVELVATNMVRELGEGAGQVQVPGGSSGFSAINGPVVVALGGLDTSVALTWGSDYFKPGALVLNSTQSNNTLEFRNSIDLAADEDRMVTVVSSTATLSGEVSNSLSGGLIKNGGGVLALTAYNSYSGATTVDAGVLRAIDAAGLPYASNLVLSNGVFETSYEFLRDLGAGGGEVQVPGGTSGFSAFGSPLVVSLGGLANPTPLVWGDMSASAAFSPDVLVLNAATADNVLDFQNPLDLNGADRTVQVAVASAAYAATLSGMIENTAGVPGGLIKTGPGVLALTNTFNSYDGGTTIQAGVLAIGDDAVLGTGPLTFSGGTLRATADFTSDQVVVLNANAPIETNSFSVTLNGPISGEAGAVLTKNTSGTLMLSGDNTYAGGTTVNMGVLRLGSSTALGTGTVMVIGVGGATVNAGQLDLNGQTISNTVAPAFRATGPFNSGCIVNSDFLNTAVLDGDLQIGGNQYTGGDGNIVINGLVTGGVVGTGNDYAFFQQGAGTWTFARTDNTFDGWYYIVGGGVTEVTKLANLNEPSSLGRATTAENNRIFFYPFPLGGTLRYIGDTASTTDRSIVVNAASNVIEASGTSAEATLTITGEAKPTDAAIRTFTLAGTNSGDNVYQGAIGGNISLAKSGTGKWALTGTNTYTGTTAVMEGVLVASKPGALPGYDVAGKVTVAGGATLALRAGGATEWISPSITALLNGGAFLPESNLGVDVAEGNSFDHVEPISGVQGLVKLGGGALALSAVNTYEGGTTVQEGALVVAASEALPVGGALTIGEGGTVVLGSGLSAAGASSASAAQAVPEPATWALMLAAALGALAVRFCRRN